VVFTLMAGFVAVVTISAVQAHQHRGTADVSGMARSQVGGASGSSGATAGTAAAAATGTTGGSAAAGGSAASRPAVSQGGSSTDSSGVYPDSPRRLLDINLEPVLARQSGQVAVGVVNLTTGARAAYAGRRSFPTAGIARAGILAALLLRHQQAAQPLPARERVLAQQMIEDGANGAAAALWRDAGGAAGARPAAARLHLRHTVFGARAYRGVTRTTVDDQLRLLADLSVARSPLSAASRSFALSLLRHVSSGQAWGVPETATAGTASAVTDGWRWVTGHGRRWVTDSIGVVQHGGQVLLVAVLGQGQPSRTAGIAQDEAAATAAVAALSPAR
jgi:hypothetical protein